MKRVKMIVTTAVVLAIVGSAFAFKAKKILTVCYTTGTANTDCKTVTNVRRTTCAGVFVLEYTLWDGMPVNCTGGTNTCNTQVKITAD